MVGWRRQCEGMRASSITLVPAQPLNSSPALGLQGEAKGGACGAACVPCWAHRKVWGKEGSVVSSGQRTGVLWPSWNCWHGFECRCGCEGRANPRASTHANDEERCPVVGAALAMAECTAGVGSAHRTEEPPLRHLRRWTAR